jgi:hypothetical protein
MVEETRAVSRLSASSARANTMSRFGASLCHKERGSHQTGAKYRIENAERWLSHWTFLPPSCRRRDAFSTNGARSDIFVAASYAARMSGAALVRIIAARLDQTTSHGHALPDAHDDSYLATAILPGAYSTFRCLASASSMLRVQMPSVPHAAGKGVVPPRPIRHLPAWIASSMNMP